MPMQHIEEGCSTGLLMEVLWSCVGILSPGNSVYQSQTPNKVKSFKVILLPAFVSFCNSTISGSSWKSCPRGQFWSRTEVLDLGVSWCRELWVYVSEAETAWIGALIRNTGVQCGRCFLILLAKPLGCPRGSADSPSIVSRGKSLFYKLPIHNQIFTELGL